MDHTAFHAQWLLCKQDNDKLELVNSTLCHMSAGRRFDVNGSGAAGKHIDILAAMCTLETNEPGEERRQAGAYIAKIAPHVKALLPHYQPNPDDDPILCGVQLLRALACCETILSPQQLQRLTAMMTRGEDIDAKSAAGRTPLSAVAAAAARDTFGCEPESDDCRTVPLLQQMAFHLLRNGADPFCLDASGNTPLSMWAGRYSLRLLQPILQRAHEWSQITVGIESRAVNAAGKTLIQWLEAIQVIDWTESLAAKQDRRRKAVLIATVPELAQLYADIRPQIAADLMEALHGCKDVADLVFDMFESASQPQAAGESENEPQAADIQD